MIYMLLLFYQVSNIAVKRDETNSNILDTFDIYQNTEIPKPFTQEEKILDKERNEILSCKEKILNYM